MTARCKNCAQFVGGSLSECGRCFAARTRQGLSVNAYAVNSNTPPAPDEWNDNAIALLPPDRPPVSADAANELARGKRQKPKPVRRTRWYKLLKGRI